MATNCPGCNKPMIDCQAFNGLLKCHWDCQDIVREKIGQDEADAMIQRNINLALLNQGITPANPMFERLGGKL